MPKRNNKEQTARDVQFLLKIARYGKLNPMHDTARLVEIAERLEILGRQVDDLQLALLGIAEDATKALSKQYPARGVAEVSTELRGGQPLALGTPEVTLGNAEPDWMRGKPNVVDADG